MSANAHVIHTIYMGRENVHYINRGFCFFFFFKDNLAGECMSGVRGEILEWVWLQVVV